MKKYLSSLGFYWWCFFIAGVLLLTLWISSNWIEITYISRHSNNTQYIFSIHSGMIDLVRKEGPIDIRNNSNSFYIAKSYEYSWLWALGRREISHDHLFWAPIWIFIVVLEIWPIYYVVIRRLRLRTNQCPICEYDLRGLDDPGCPECGWKRKSV